MVAFDFFPLSFDAACFSGISCLDVWVAGAEAGAEASDVAGFVFGFCTSGGGMTNFGFEKGASGKYWFAESASAWIWSYQRKRLQKWPCSATGKAIAAGATVA